MLPREKLSLWGVTSLSVADLVAVILSAGSIKKNVFDLAKEVEKILKNSKGKLADFEQIEGLGRVKAMKLACVVELGFRINGKDGSLKRIISTQQAYETLRYIGGYRQEHFVCIYLNARYEVVGKKTVGIGTVSSVQILPRDIILAGLTFNASYVIMAHNHPSNDATPSDEDREVSQRIKYALDIVGMELLDNLVITKDSWSRVDVL